MSGDHDELKQLLRFLAHGAGLLVARSNTVRLVRKDGATLRVREGIFSQAAGLNLVSRDGNRISATPLGLAYLRNGNRSETALPEGIGEIVFAPHTGGDTPAGVLSNAAESPLALLRRRTGARAEPFLTGEEFAAGERLRADYARGQIMPRLGANWVAAVSSGRRSGSGGAAELTDAALAARLRVEKALAAVGPELAGVLVDICCYLKGLERVESERSWPARSAKVVLKTALVALGRHYDPPRSRTGRRFVQWGTPDYRPEITG